VVQVATKGSTESKRELSDIGGHQTHFLSSLVHPKCICGRGSDGNPTSLYNAVQTP